MSFKKTVIVSVFFHFCFFTAALLLSANLLGGSSRTHNERVFFVKLTEGKGQSIKQYMNPRTTQRRVVQAVLKTKILKPKKSLQVKKTENYPVSVGTNSSRDAREGTVSVDEEGLTQLSDQDSNNLIAQDQNIGNELTEDHEDGEDEVANITSGLETAVNVPHGSFFSGDEAVLKSKGSGVFPQGIIEIIRNSIENVKTYPVLARKRGLEGTVYISFRISPQGKAHDIKVLKSSGYRILDKTTLDIVKKAAPYPHVNGPIEVPVVFKLKN